MMKIRVFLAALFLSPLFCMAQQKLASINMEKVFQNYYKTARSESSLKQQELIYEEHAKRLSEDIEKFRIKRDELKEKSLNVALTEKAREDSRQQAEEQDRVFQEKRQELRDFMQKKQKELQKRYLEERKLLVQELTVFIQNFAKAEKLDFIFDSSGLTSNLIPVLIYASSLYDVTDTILVRLNQGHESELEALKEKSGGAAEK